ncbi:hypothetical protein OKE80_04920 [Riemerella anatipestifer]|uniref:DUF3575 domain-containing protein n=1 Tax=Riemerella anatipestifer TaxID=34085 RepID=A0AAP3AKN3_RIEAN|nr:hypothetical protein [Riemerella anatipestifer]AZZ59099.1 hypothetical protein AWB57_08725 [Riemerella anatipestifer]MBT0573606.1 hypothetical protein [Riemerella anatipestifer]MCO7318685.1 hypothetical protein [Riemerella anatipestifer]MCQ4154999.1 hypothetical protein [Riemerella anatipestifer]MCQ4180949.1 hypothetical protein [Riemerella anatipestifer]
MKNIFINKTKTILLVLVLVLFGLFYAKAQNKMATHPMIFVGYNYQNASFGEVGGRLLFLKKDNIMYRLGASAMLGSPNGKFVVIPKLQGDILFNFQEDKTLNHSYYGLIGIETTTKYFAPKVGLSFFGILDFTAGYAFQIPNQTVNDKSLKGFNVGVGLNIPVHLKLKL